MLYKTKINLKPTILFTVWPRPLVSNKMKITFNNKNEMHVERTLLYN